MTDINDPVVERATREQLEEAFKDSVPAVSLQVDECSPALTPEQLRELEARTAARVQDHEVRNGTRLVAADGTRYVVSNLQHRYVPMVVRSRPVAPAALEVGSRTTLTLRHEESRATRLARRREEKRMRKKTARYASSPPDGPTAPIDWARLDAELLGGDR